MDALKPEVSLLSKLGSIALHAEEFLSPGAHPFDIEAIKALLLDPEVREWIAAMDKMAFLPVKRNNPVGEQPKKRRNRNVRRD